MEAYESSIMRRSGASSPKFPFCLRADTEDGVAIASAGARTSSSGDPPPLTPRPSTLRQPYLRATQSVPCWRSLAKLGFWQALASCP